jgi:hypothetical protein
MAHSKHRGEEKTALNAAFGITSKPGRQLALDATDASQRKGQTQPLQRSGDSAYDDRKVFSRFWRVPAPL